MPTFYGTDTPTITQLAASGVTSVSFSADSSLIYAAAGSTITVYNAATGSVVTSWNIAIPMRALSLSEDGSFLLATRADLFNSIVRISTVDGSIQTFTDTGLQQVFSDVEIVDGQTAILTGSAPRKFDLATGAFTPLSGAVYYAGGSFMVEDSHLTLLAEGGISNGPLFLYDDRTGSITAFGDNYQSGMASGFNWGVQAISEAAGQVAQFIYYSSVNIFDLSLHAVRNVQVGGPLSGLAYSADGKFLYALRGDNGYLVKYSTTDFTVADQYLVGVLGSYSSEAYGDQIRFAVNGDTMTVFGGGILKLVKLAPNDDVMPGTAGADSFYGYGGNDTYTVNDAGDQVFEDPGKGTDTVLSSISYALAANVENLVLTGSSALSGTGNPLANVITGNAGASSLSGMGGNDRLLVTASGSGSAVDGGADFDTLVVSGAVSLGSIAAIEALELTAGATLTLTSTQSGTGLPLNAVVSGSGALVINFDPGVSVPTKLYNFTGFTGSITINGSSGVDVMKLGNVAHTANGGDGIDQIKGGSAADTIDGGNGGDKINGAGGADILTGGAGNDVFKYANGSDSGLGAASDRITDFTIGQDRLNFSKIDADAALAGDQAFTFLGTAAFTNTGLGQLRYLTAGADLIVQADVNGDGVADMEVILQGLSGQVLTGADIVL